MFYAFSRELQKAIEAVKYLRGGAEGVSRLHIWATSWRYVGKR